MLSSFHDSPYFFGMPGYHQPPPRPDPSQVNKLSTGSRPERVYLSIASPVLAPTTTTHCKAWFSPFDWLPIELQVEIFSHCFAPFPNFNINEAPLLIARVCSAWRSHALSTPKLWSSFEIKVAGCGTSVSLRDLYIVSTMKLWLARSKNYPLAMRVIHAAVGRRADQRSAQLLAILIPEARRWQHVEFIMPATNVAPLRKLLPGDIPMLQSFTLQMKGLWNSEPTWDLLAKSVPWNQLTSLDLQVENNNLPTLDQCLDILLQVENLKHCTINVACTLDRTKVRMDGIFLLPLETLHLELQGVNFSPPLHPNVIPAGCLFEFLNLLLAPNLQTLELAWLASSRGRQTWSGSLPEFLSFLQRASQTLRVFSLSYLPLSDVELMECLTVVPEVRLLDLRFSLSDHEHDPIIDNLLRACTYTAPWPTSQRPSSSPSSSEAQKRLSQAQPSSLGPSPLLPHLEYANIQCNGERYTNPVLLALIQSRWRRLPGSASSCSSSSVLKISQFHLLSMKPVVAEVAKCVQVWSSEGMNISIDSLNIRLM